MTDIFDQPDDAATPLTPEEKKGLIPSYIATRGELNEAEQANIVTGQRWALARRRDVLDENYLLQLHKRMFGEVWDWAGKFRLTERNIGIASYRIGPEFRSLVLDARYWVEHRTYPPDEIAARFHHRLVFIHPFPNGNGRHARMAADLLARQLDRKPSSWGAGDLTGAGETRKRYVAALRAADDHDLGPLLDFIRGSPGTAE